MTSDVEYLSFLGCEENAILLLTFICYTKPRKTSVTVLPNFVKADYVGIEESLKIDIVLNVNGSHKRSLGLYFYCAQSRNRYVYFHDNSGFLC